MKMIYRIGILVFVMDWLQDLPGIPQIEANPITCTYYMYTYIYILDAYTRCIHTYDNILFITRDCA